MQKDTFNDYQERLTGRNAQKNNILAAKTISDIIKTTLGPKGMDKMLVNSNGEIIITNDGVTILSEMEIEHPIGKMMVEIAKTQESEVGDGTTSSVMIAGKLLENAEKLIDNKIHPTIISKGYKMAQQKAQEVLLENALKIDLEDNLILKQIAMTAMTGKSAEEEKENLSQVLVEAINLIRTDNLVDLKDIKLEKIIGKDTNKTELIKGIVLDKERLSQDMPEKVIDSKILLIDFSIESKLPEAKSNISFNTHNELQNFLEGEEKYIKDSVDKIIESGANVLFTQKGIDDYAVYLLAKKGIYVCRRIPKSDLERISKATGGKIISNLNEISEEYLGYAQEVKEIVNSNNKMTYINGCKNPKSITILIYGSTTHVLEEIERAILDALGDIFSLIKTKLIVSGGGSIEVELSRKIREFSNTVSGKEKLAIEEFANALEFIPSTLAENAGLDPIDILSEIKRRHELGEKNTGLNLFNNKIENMLNSRIIEPYMVKLQAINSATDVTNMILRIDDIILSKSKSNRDEEKISF